MSSDVRRTAAHRLRVFFVMRHAGFARNVESVLHELLAHGHEVVIGFEASKPGLDEERVLLSAIDRDHPGTRVVTVPKLRNEAAHLVARRVRLGLDYLRYKEPPLSTAPELRRRARRLAPASIRVLGDLAGDGHTRRLAALRRALQALDRSLPRSKGLQGLLDDIDPDVVVVTPLVQFGGVQTELLRAAAEQGRRTCLVVASWDNLTNKGLIHEIPDIVTVWNEIQRREAVELHGVPPERVRVTGANSFDHWFGWEPSVTAAEFREHVGLPVGPPLLLYVCSSPFITGGREVAFVRRWLQTLRSLADTRDAAVLIRPHPLGGEAWSDVDLDGFGPVAVWPPMGSNPTDDERRADFFDSLHHAHAVVGINTSALIESAIVGRPVYTVLDPAFGSTQDGTLHFRYLLREAGGPLHVASDLDEHAMQLAESLRAEDEEGDPHARAFVASFVRPLGLDRPGAREVVRAIEADVGLRTPAAHAPDLRDLTWRIALAPLTIAMMVLGFVRNARPTLGRALGRGV